MIFKDIPIGSNFILGQYEGDSLYWCKIDTNKAMCVKTFRLPLDYPRGVHGRTKRVSHYGETFIPKTKLYEFLNSEEYVKPVVDGTNYYNPWPYSSFISSFDEKEISALVPETKRVPIPGGLKKDFDKAEKIDINYLVNLPDVTDINNGIANCAIRRYNTYAIIGTSPDYGQQYTSGLIQNFNPSVTMRVQPVIKVKDDAECYVDENNCYRISHHEYHAAFDELYL